MSDADRTKTMQQQQQKFCNMFFLGCISVTTATTIFAIDCILFILLRYLIIWLSSL